jgi:hypothetical protein
MRALWKLVMVLKAVRQPIALGLIQIMEHLCAVISDPAFKRASNIYSILKFKLYTKKFKISEGRHSNRL